MSDLQTSDMRQKRQMMSALPLASARISKLLILCLNDILNGDLCKISLFQFFSFIWFSNRCGDLSVSQLKTQQVMTSLIRSHIEYLIQT